MNLDEKEQLFQEGFEATQNAPELLGNYANFLTDQRRDDAHAEEYYLKAITADPAASADGHEGAALESGHSCANGACLRLLSSSSSSRARLNKR